MSEQQELIALLEDTAQRFITEHETPLGADDGTIWQAMAELGWLGLCLPESHGGAGLGGTEASALTRMFGRHAFTNRYIGQCVMPSLILGHSPIENEKVAQISEQLSTGESAVVVAWQEKAGQLDGSAPSTSINNSELSGKKAFVAGADKASHFLVTACSDDKLIIALVERNAPGVSVELPFSSDLGFGTVEFDQVSLTENARLLQGDSALLALTDSLQISRVTIAAELEGLAAGCLETTLEHVKTRKQFGKAIGSFQSIRHRCVDLFIATRLAESGWRRALQDYNISAEPSDNYRVSAAKARCGDTAFKVAKEGVQMHGAMGFTEEAGIGRYLRSAITRSAWLGSPQQHRTLLAEAIKDKEFFDV